MNIIKVTFTANNIATMEFSPKPIKLLQVKFPVCWLHGFI